MPPGGEFIGVSFVFAENKTDTRGFFKGFFSRFAWSFDGTPQTGEVATGFVQRPAIAPQRQPEPWRSSSEISAD
jgi:hypothetical protein